MTEARLALDTNILACAEGVGSEERCTAARRLIAYLSVAAEYGCRLLLSEDLQPGSVWRGVTVVNPFVQPWPPALEALLG